VGFFSEIKENSKHPPKTLAYKNSRCTDLKDVRGSWQIPKRGSHEINFIWNAGKKGKKRRCADGGGRDGKKAKRDFGNTVNQDYVAIAPKHNPSTHYKTHLRPDSPLRPLQCDVDTADDELYVGCYVGDIMKHYFESEDKYLPTPGYIEEKQTNIQKSMRVKMLDWLLSVATRFEQTDGSFHLAVNIFDRYMSAKNVDKKRLQLVGSVCLWLAAKYCEIRVAEMSDFVHVSEHCFTEQDMLEVESDIVNTLDFDFTVPTSLSFAQRFCHVVKYLLQTEKQKKRLIHLVNYYLEYCLLIYELVGKKPSLIAAAATYAAAFWLDKDFQWNEDMIRVTGYDVPDFKNIVGIIKKEIYETKRGSCHVANKYKERKRECVSLMKYTGK